MTTRAERIAAGQAKLLNYGLLLMVFGGVAPQLDLLYAREQVGRRKAELKSYREQVDPAFPHRAEVEASMQEDVRQAGRVYAASLRAAETRKERRERIEAGRTVLRAFVATPAGQAVQALADAHTRLNRAFRRELDLDGLKAALRAQAQARRAQAGTAA